MAPKAKIPRTHQMISVFKKQLYKTNWKIERTLKVGQNRWKVHLRDKTASREKVVFVDKSDMRTLRKFKSVVRHQV